MTTTSKAISQNSWAERDSQGMGSRNDLALSVPSSSPPASDPVSSDCRNLSTFPFMEGSLWATNFIHLSFSHTHRLASLSPNSKFSGEVIRLVQHESGVFPCCQGVVSESMVLFNGEETSQTRPAY